MKPALSVIIPVYNGEKTLSAAVESVLCQTRKNIEIVIVNDGSKDSSKQLIEKYSETDPRIVFVDKQKNAGLSAARNSGLEAATGEYFTFVDVDDWIEPNFYETLLSNANGAEVVVSGFFHETLAKDGSVSVSVENKTNETVTLTDRAEILEKAATLDRKRLFAFSWNKIYKRDFIDTLGIKYNSAQTLIEDYEYNCYVFQKLSKLTLVDGCFYHYIKFSEEALTQKYLPDYFEIIDRRYVLMKNLLEGEGAFSGENREIVCSMHIKHVFSGMVKNCSKKSPLSSKEQRAVIKKIFKDANCLEAIKYAKGTRKQENLVNALFSTKSVVLNFLAAKALYAMQNSKGNLFDKLK